MKKIEKLLNSNKKLVSVFITANFPEPNRNLFYLKALEQSGVDFVELGIPCSDPLADGPIIQNSSTMALKNGFTISNLFRELRKSRKQITIPIIIMGYYNQIIQFGIKKFVHQCKLCSIEGLIIPDAPISGELFKICKKEKIAFIPMICPETPLERVQYIDKHTNGFIYAVTKTAVTGKSNDVDCKYMKKVSRFTKNKLIAGFGIVDATSFLSKTKYASGGIIGSSFIQFITKETNRNQIAISKFIKQFK